MYTKFFFTTLMIFILGLSCAVSGELAVGVKKGDWIMYNVTYSGIPLAGHDVIEARMDILDITEASIEVKITSKYSNGSLSELATTLNLEKGQLGDDFIIPANLTSGSTFYDRNYGNITINKVEQRQYAGSTRWVLYATRDNNTYVWDQATGISLEGTTDTPEFSIHTIVEKTNIWQQASALDSAAILLLLLLIIATLMIIFAIFVIMTRKRRKLLQKAPN